MRASEQDRQDDGERARGEARDAKRRADGHDPSSGIRADGGDEPGETSRPPAGFKPG